MPADHKHGRQPSGWNRDLVMQWTGVLLPPTAVLFDLNLSYILVQYACLNDAAYVLWLVTLATFLMLALSWYCAHRAWADGKESPNSRTRFMGLTGLLLTVLSVILTVAMMVPKIMIAPCS